MYTNMYTIYKLNINIVYMSVYISLGFIVDLINVRILTRKGAF